MFLLIIVLAGAGVYVEMKVVNTVPWIGRYLEKYRLCALAFSLGLSILLGTFFGAEGLIVFASGILSTVAIQPWYSMRKNGTLAKYHAKRDELTANYYAKKDLYVRRARQVQAFVIFVWKVVTFPFKVLGMILDLLDRISSSRASE